MKKQTLSLDVSHNGIRRYLLTTYLILVAIVSRVLISLDVRVGIIILFLLLIPAFFALKWPNNHYTLFIALVIFLTGKLLLAIYVDPLIGPDAVRYHQQIHQFPSFHDFLTYFLNHVKEYGLMSSSYPIFGIIYLPIYNFFNTNEPLVITVINGIFLVAACFLFSIKIRNFFKTQREILQLIILLLVVMMFLSPILMYYSSSFSKDIASLLSILLVVHLLLKKRYILAVLLLAYATALRPYSIVAIVAYYAVFKKSKQLLISSLLIAFGILILRMGFVLGVINPFLVTGFLLISPNPLNSENWTGVNAYLLLEALFLLGIVILSLFVFISAKQTRSFYLTVLLALLLYSSALTLVGYSHATSYNVSYGIGSAGDNFLRKKIPMIPLIYLYVSHTISWICKLIRSGSIKRERGVFGFNE